MFTATRKYKINNVQYEDNSTVIWIDRTEYKTGKPFINYVPVPEWGNGKELEKAAKKVFRLTF